MEDLDKRIDEIMELEAKIENCISGTGSAQDYDYLLNVRATKAPEMVSIIKELQAQVVERDRVITELQEVGMFYLADMKRQLTESLLEDANHAVAFKRSNLENRIRLTETKLGIAK